jgi:GT2 family glycosyltransferase
MLCPTCGAVELALLENPNVPTTITVVTPSYNQGQFLEDTLRSVISQRPNLHEYFVFDGGSSDNSVDVIRRYQGGIDFWESKKDRGQSDAIHKGFARATGDVLGWLNSDDVLLPGALEKVQRKFDDDPQLDVITAWHVKIGPENQILTAHRVPGESLHRAMWGEHHVCQQTCFFRRRLYEAVGGLDLTLHCVMDTELWYRMWQHGSRWGHLNAYLAGFRLHETAKGQSWIKEYAQEDALMTQRYPQFREKNLKHHVGRNLYRVRQILSGRFLLAALETAKWRGKKAAQVFGDWTIQSAGPTEPKSSREPLPCPSGR